MVRLNDSFFPPMKDHAKGDDLVGTTSDSIPKFLPGGLPLGSRSLKTLGEHGHKL